MIDPEEFTIQYGPKTMEKLVGGVNNSFKIFWDGGVSNFSDTIKSADNNKVFLNTMLEMRAATE